MLKFQWDMNQLVFFADLFLYNYKNRRQIRKIHKTDLRSARWFANVFRFIDDLAVFNGGVEFERNYNDIYPLELELERKIRLHKKGHF